MISFLYFNLFPHLQSMIFMEKENKRIPNLLVLPMSPEDWGFFILSQIVNGNGGG